MTSKKQRVHVNATSKIKIFPKANWILSSTIFTQFKKYIVREVDLEVEKHIRRTVNENKICSIRESYVYSTSSKTSTYIERVWTMLQPKPKNKRICLHYKVLYKSREIYKET